MNQLPLLNFDELFRNSPDAIVVSYSDSVSDSKIKAKEQLQSMVSDYIAPLSFVASCDCGTLTGNFYEGKVCPKCGTKAEQPIVSDLRYKIWLEIPDELPPVLHPAYYRILCKWAGSKGKESIIGKILDVDAKLPADLNIPYRGFVDFYEHFDEIIEMLLVYKKSKPQIGKTAKINEEANANIFEFVKKYRNLAFCRHLPILDSSLHILTRSGTITYCDHPTPYALKAKIELHNLIHILRNSPMTTVRMNRRMLAFYTQYIEYGKTCCESKLFTKTGVFRKCVNGVRTHWSYRGVITPLAGDYMGDELHLPWGIGIQLLQFEILGALLRKGYTLTDAYKKYRIAEVTYDEEIDRIMQQLIDECLFSGLPVLFGRNPSIRHGAEMLLFVTRIKNDLYDSTINLSPMIVGPYNADFDGDAGPKKSRPL